MRSGLDGAARTQFVELGHGGFEIGDLEAEFEGSGRMGLGVCPDDEVNARKLEECPFIRFLALSITEEPGVEIG